MKIYSLTIFHKVLTLHFSFATGVVETRDTVQANKDVICLPPRPEILVDIHSRLLSLLLHIVCGVRVLLPFFFLDTLPFHSR